jgi:serralysin
MFSQLANADGETATVTGVGTTIQAAADTAVTNIGLNAHGNNAVLGNGNEQVTVSAAGTRIWGTHGTDTINVNAGGGTIWGGGAAITLNMTDYHDQAAVTLHGGGGLITQEAGYGALVFTGGHGAAMLGGVSGGETVTAGSGNISLVGGGAGTHFTAGSGNANVTLTRAGGTVIFGNGSCVVQEAAGGSTTTYDFNKGTGGGNDTITGFQVGTDHLVMQGVTINGDSVVNGSTLLSLSDGTHVTLVGVTNFHT